MAGAVRDMTSLIGDPTLPVLILGAGNHGRNVAMVLRDAGRPVLGFLDDTKTPGERIDDMEVLGGFATAGALLQRAALHVAIGNSATRERLSRSLAVKGACFASALHPSAVISSHAQLGAALYVAPFVRISPGAVVGEGCLIESNSVIGTDSILEPFVMLALQCSLTAGSRVGARTFLGVGTTVTGAAIGCDCVIGAASLVLQDVPDGARAQGQPARVIGPADSALSPV